MIGKEHIGEKLLAVLEKHGVTQKYLDNCNVTWLNRPDMIIHDEEELDTAFIWKDTPEGHWFWSDIDDEFRDSIS